MQIFSFLSALPFLHYQLLYKSQLFPPHREKQSAFFKRCSCHKKISQIWEMKQKKWFLPGLLPLLPYY